ncbi:enhancer of mRNA decapping 4 [Phyllostomus discolor]|uniref:Enhancer of mRNA decapping 4 n=1 Tax=Phyllostomus discolor TaxID=89673 RepID=A0A833YQC4_9CHIR|nr:enhancer of mRNA decapping 4 [Phyllostomus discolor]
MPPYTLSLTRAGQQVVVLTLLPLPTVTMTMRWPASPLLRGALAPKFPLHGCLPRTGRLRDPLGPHPSSRRRAKKMMGRRGPGTRERGGPQATCMTWPEVLLAYGRDSAMESRLTERQVSEQTPFLLLGLLSEGGEEIWAIPWSSVWGQVGQVSCNYRCCWQVAEPSEDWPALIWQQQRELLELRHSQEELLQRLCSQLEGLQSTVTGHVERALESRHEQEQRRLERALAEGQQRGGQLQEQLTQQLSQALSSAVAGRLERSIRDEIKKTVPPCVSRSLEPVAGQLSTSVATKLTAVEGSMKENISKLLKSKNLTDAIARAAADTLQGPMQAAYREAFQSVVLPAFEKSCQAMFQQINDSFRLGTQEYLQQLESHMKSRKAREQEAREPVLAQLRGLVSTLQGATEQMAATVSSSVRAEVQHQLHLAVGSLQESILAQVQRIVKGEVSVALKEQQAAVTSSIMQAMRSAAGTPVPAAHLDCQAQQAHILQLLQQGHLNQAFQQALTAADLNLVLYVCETVDPGQVFGQPPCPLSQPVLLSLIQQLASDLGTRTDLKLSYLEDAVMHLDHSDPITRDHMGSVMAQVRQKLFQFLQAEPHNSLGKAARRLSLMLHGLVTPSLP